MEKINKAEKQWREGKYCVKETEWNQVHDLDQEVI